MPYPHCKRMAADEEDEEDEDEDEEDPATLVAPIL
jgi:hypothetical protein